MYLHLYNRPLNKEELFNLQHVMARNVIERAFGVLKKRFKILVIPPDFTMDIQARIPAALAAIHNFIRAHDSPEINDYSEYREHMTAEPAPDAPSNIAYGEGELATGLPRTAEKTAASERRDGIALAMWAQYQAELRQRGEA